jgi:hypothetical protein
MLSLDVRSAICMCVSYGLHGSNTHISVSLKSFFSKRGAKPQPLHITQKLIVCAVNQYQLGWILQIHLTCPEYKQLILVSYSLNQCGYHSACTMLSVVSWFKSGKQIYFFSKGICWYSIHYIL